MGPIEFQPKKHNCTFQWISWIFSVTKFLKLQQQKIRSDDKIALKSKINKNMGLEAQTLK